MVALVITKYEVKSDILYLLLTSFLYKLPLLTDRESFNKMQHTHLRYECADAFALATTAGTTSISTTKPLCFLPALSARDRSSSSSSILLSTSGSQIVGFNLRTNEPCLKVAHREHLSGGLGTGKALNSDQVLVICTSASRTNGAKLATGWNDGAIRIFEIESEDLQGQVKLGLAHSLLFQKVADGKEEEFMGREPLLLNGHSGTPITCLSFDASLDATTLASGSTDGTIILWDILNGTLRFCYY
jgi:WD40 repeat protein